METEDLWDFILRHGVDLINVSVIRVVTRGESVCCAVNTYVVHGAISVVQDLLSHEVLQQRTEDTSVLLLSDSTAIVALTNQVAQSVERHICVLLDKVVKLSH